MATHGGGYGQDKTRESEEVSEERESERVSESELRERKSERERGLGCSLFGSKRDIGMF